MRKIARSSKRPVEAGVQLARRGEVASERLLDDDPGALVEPGPHQAADDAWEHAWRDRKVERRVAGGAELFPQAIERHRIPIIAAHVREVARERVEIGVRRHPVDVEYGFPGVRSQLVIVPGGSCDPDDRDTQSTLGGEAKQRGMELLTREIACRAEDHEGVRDFAHFGLRGGGCIHPFALRITTRVKPVPILAGTG